MPVDDGLATLEPDLVGVVRNHWKLIAIVAVGLGILGFLVGSTREDQWRATASVVAEDPRSSTLFEAGTETRPERYVETQIGILASPAVSERASELLKRHKPPIDLDTDEMLAGTTVTSADSSDLISVSFTGGSELEAEAGADAVVTAYLELRKSESVAGFSTALAQLDESIANSEAEIDELDSSIRALSSGNPQLAELEQQYREALARLRELQNSEEVPDANEVAVISQQINGIEAAINIESQRPELTALLEEQSLAMSRLSGLITRRNEVAVDAELAGGGFVFQSPARPATRVNPGPRVYGLVGVVLGALIGVGVAYGFAVRRRRVDSAEEPELILHTPLLGAIPTFDPRIDTDLPVANAADSQAAEAFRFVMAAVDSQLSTLGVVDTGKSADGGRMIFVTSTDSEDGSTSVVANMAVAAARSGRSVVVLDADFRTQGLTRLLLPDSEAPVGIADVAIGASNLDPAIRKVPIGTGLELFMLPRGSDVLSAQDLFESREAADVLRKLRARHDLVLVDSPSFLQVGYATTLARLADHVLLVVRHRTLLSNLEELRRRLSLVHVRDIGYVYNRAPMVSHLYSVGRHSAPQELPVPSEPSVTQEAVRKTASKV